MVGWAGLVIKVTIFGLIEVVLRSGGGKDSVSMMHGYCNVLIGKIWFFLDASCCSKHILILSLIDYSSLGSMNA